MSIEHLDQQTVVGLLGTLAAFAAAAATFFLQDLVESKKLFSVSVARIREHLMDFSDALFDSRLDHDADSELRSGLELLVAARPVEARLMASGGGAGSTPVAIISRVKSPLQKLHAMSIAIVLSALPDQSRSSSFAAVSTGVARLRLPLIRDDLRRHKNVAEESFANRLDEAASAFLACAGSAATDAAAASERTQNRWSASTALALAAALLAAFCLNIIGSKGSDDLEGSRGLLNLLVDPTGRAMEVVTIGLFILLAGIAAAALERSFKRQWSEIGSSLQDAVEAVLSPRFSRRAAASDAAVSLTALGILIYSSTTSPFLSAWLASI